jgi:chromosome partitioning protein
MGRVLSISNQKGGVGKTTTAINLAASLAAAERKTLLIDIDPQGNAGSGLGFGPGDYNNGTVYEALLDGVPMKETLLETDLRYLHLCPATPDLTGAEIELVGRDQREMKLKEAIAPLRNEYDYIVIDCPPSLGLLTLNSLSACDSVVVPLQCEYYALEGLSHLVKTIQLVRQGLNPKLNIEGILLTMFDGRVSIAHQVADEVRKHFPKQVFKTVVPRNVRLSECPSHGKPILLYDIKSKGCEAYLSLAREVMRRDAKASKLAAQAAQAAHGSAVQGGA